MDLELETCLENHRNVPVDLNDPNPSHETLTPQMTFFTESRRESVLSECNSHGINKFINFLMVMIEIFTEAMAASYDNCSRLEKQLVKIVLIRKFALKPKYFPGIGLSTDEPFSSSDVAEFAAFKSPKRENEISLFLIKKFMSFEFGRFLEREYRRKSLSKSQIFEARKQFYRRIFPKQTKTTAQLKKVISTFVRLQGSKNRELNRYFRNQKHQYKSNFKYPNSLKLIASQPDMLQEFRNFFENGRNSRAVELCNLIALKKCLDFVSKMEKEYKTKEHSEASFLAYFKDLLDNPKTKLPMHTIDVQNRSLMLLIEIDGFFEFY